MLLGEHGEAVTADLWHHYHGLDVRDLWRPGGGRSGLTWRLLNVLIQGLPPESLTKTALRNAAGDEEVARLADTAPDGYGPWSQMEHLLAAAIDRLGAIHAAVYRAQGVKPNEAPYPDPWPRPGVRANQRRRRLSAAGLAYLQRLRDEHARLYGTPDPTVPGVNGAGQS